MLKDVVEFRMKNEKLSVRAAAKQIGIAHTSLARFLNGSRIDISTMEKLSKWANVPMTSVIQSADLVTGDPLAAKLSMLLNANPSMRQVLQDAMDRMESGTISPQVLTDILDYTAFKLSTMPRR